MIRPAQLQAQTSYALWYLAFGVLLAVTSRHAWAATPAQELSRFDLNLFTVTQAPEAFGSRRAPYSFSASLMLTQGSGLRLDSLRDTSTLERTSPDDSNARQLPKDAAGRPLFGDSEPSLGARFRLESKGQRFEVRPRRRSIWFQYSADF